VESMQAFEGFVEKMNTQAEEEEDVDQPEEG
jgi:hypothetical protein